MMNTMKSTSRNAERGIALFFALFALLLLTAIACTMTFMASIETSVNSNYRQEQMAYFGAKAGLEEARARMMQTDPNSINATGTALPTVVPTTTGLPSPGVIYIVNPGATANSVQPWSTSNAYADDDLCHDGYAGAPPNLFTTAQVVVPGVPCTSNGKPVGTPNATPLLPSTTTWYTSTNSKLPYNGTSSALPYKWVRIAPKLNSSMSYLTVSGGTATLNNYTVNSGSPNTGATLICWDGQHEQPLSTGVARCNLMVTSGTNPNCALCPMSPVYLIASLGISPQGARKMVQAEVALQPTPPFIYGLYATSTACPAITFTGNNPSTDSYTTAAGQTYSQTHSTTGGDIGTPGGVSVGNGNVGGIVGVLPYVAGPPSSGCNLSGNEPVSLGSQGTILSGVGTTTCPGGNRSTNTALYPTPASDPGCFMQVAPTFSVPVVSTAPPNTTTNPSTCGSGNSSYDCFAPGTYGNISIQHTLTLAPGIYNINSLSMTGNAGIIVSPPGAVTLNVAGNGQSNPVAVAGNGITDDTIPNDFIINYAGNGTVSIAGNGNVTAILNAPKATITQQGNGNWYGSILGSQMTIGGNAFFHYDRNAALSPLNNGYYTMISYREVSY
jgi:Tfp pilus assembly protein PilX